MTGSDHVAKVKMGIVDLKGKEIVIPSKATKAHKWYVNIVNIDSAMLTCELQSVKLWYSQKSMVCETGLPIGIGLALVWIFFHFHSLCVVSSSKGSSEIRWDWIELLD